MEHLVEFIAEFPTHYQLTKHAKDFQKLTDQVLVGPNHSFRPAQMSWHP